MFSLCFHTDEYKRRWITLLQLCNSWKEHTNILSRINSSVGRVFNCIYTHIHIHTYIHTYIYIHIYVYINTYIHTYTYIHTCKWILDHIYSLFLLEVLKKPGVSTPHHLQSSRPKRNNANQMNKGVSAGAPKFQRDDSIYFQEHRPEVLKLNKLACRWHGPATITKVLRNNIHFIYNEKHHSRDVNDIKKAIPPTEAD